MLRRLSKLFLSLITCLGILSSQAIAQSPADSITLSPFLQNVQILPADAQKSLSVKITNNSSSAQTLKVSPVNFGTLDETGGVVFEGGSNSSLAQKYGLSNWLKLSADQLELQPGETATLQAIIVNDSSLKPGGHYGAILVAPQNSDSTNGSHVSINQKLSSLIFATKIGGEKYDLHLDSIKSNKSLFSLPTTLSIRFKNTGNTQLVPRGVVSLTSGSSVLARGVINQESGYILPETYRVFDVPLTKLEGTSAFGLDRYQIRVDYRYDGYDNFASKSQPGMLISPAFLISCLGLIALVIAALYAIVKKSRAKSAKKLFPAKTKAKK